MGLVSDVRRRHIGLMGKTLALLENTLTGVTQADATTYRDGADGWTVLEVVCHLRDFNEIFLQRARLITTENFPDLPAYDHEQMAIDGNYNGQNLAEVLNALRQSRLEMIEFFNALASEDWNRAGTHPERGYFTLTDAVVQVSHHDIDHLEQITRILTQKTDAGTQASLNRA